MWGRFISWLKNIFSPAKPLPPPVNPPAPVQPPAPAPEPLPNPGDDSMPICGIDVSHDEDDIQWMLVAKDPQKIKFAFIKATEGSDYQDPNFAKNWAGAKAAGIIRGAYHYFRPGMEPELQAQNFLKTVGQLQSGDMPFMIDFEVMDGVDSHTAIFRLLTFANLISQASGLIPFLYSYPDFIDSQLLNDTRLAAYPLFISNVQVVEPKIPVPWHRCTAWQYSWTGSVNGIMSNSLDMDLFMGRVEDLKAICKQGDKI